MPATLEQLREQARRELACASELTPQYRDFLLGLVPDYPVSDRRRDDIFGRLGFSRLFEAEPEVPYRPGDYLFGSGEHPLFGGTSPALAPEPQPSYAYTQRFQEAAAAQRPDSSYDALFSGADRHPAASPTGSREFDHLFSQ